MSACDGQDHYRLPQSGEGWRHYNGGLYTIVGLARDPDDKVTVVYTPFRWSLRQLPPLYTQELGRFLQELETVENRAVDRDTVAPVTIRQQ